MRIRQIILNLSFNAVKFSHSGTIEIISRLKESDEARTVIRFTVVDTGIGTSETDQRNIFQSFEQASDNTKQVHAGAVFGLAISKTLVALMEGQIDVTSELGKGCEFWTELPFVAEHCQT